MTMTVEDEEKFLIDQLNGARFALEQHKKAMSALRFEQNALEKRLEKVEEAMVDYMKGNGLVKFSNDKVSISLGKSYVVDVNDIDAVPEEFIRTKVTKEPNKVLIRELKPQGNWYTIVESDKLTIKGE